MVLWSLCIYGCEMPLCIGQYILYNYCSGNYSYCESKNAPICPDFWTLTVSQSSHPPRCMNIRGGDWCRWPTCGWACSLHATILVQEMACDTVSPSSLIISVTYSCLDQGWYKKQMTQEFAGHWQALRFLWEAPHSVKRLGRCIYIYKCSVSEKRQPETHKKWDVACWSIGYQPDVIVLTQL